MEPSIKEEWVKFFKNHCWQFYIINDISLYIFLKEYNNKIVNAVTPINFEIHGVTYSFLYFMVNNGLYISEYGEVSEEITEHFILPGSLYFIANAMSFLKKYYPKFTVTDDSSLVEYYKEWGSLPVQHIFTEEYLWALKNVYLSLYLKEFEND